MNTGSTMNQKEKAMGFAYVLILFLVITSACCVMLFLYNSNYNELKQKDFIVSKVSRSSEYRDAQKKAEPTINLLYEKIAGYDPGVNAVYEEDNIKFLINELRDIYEKHPLDTRYKSFMHVANFYYMWYADKKTMWTLTTNVLQFTKDLEECELGLSNKKDDFSKLRR
ncbi:MAG: type VI secretion system transmembrane protein TssO [Bacteroidales bacterium]|jgi:hypothetical protein|nr:type VI secretion system transmembrane protein TssO [Bacteroidales bacterium]